jgi:phage shock protein E
MTGHTLPTTTHRSIGAVGLALALALILAVVAGCSGNGSTPATSATTTVAADVTTAASGTTVTGGATAPLGTVVATKSGKGSWRRVTPAELAGMLKQKDFVFVNVHIPYAGEIAGTDLFLPYDQAAGEIGKLPADKSAKVVLYCRSGRMSTIAAEVWADAGYTNMYELAGGFDAWVAASYPMVVKSQ